MLVLDRFLGAIAEALAARGTQGEGDIDTVGVAEEVCRHLAALPAEDVAQAVLVASHEEARAASRRAADRVTDEKSRAVIERYLGAVPVTFRAGVTRLALTHPMLAPTVAVARPESLQTLLPLRVPCFRAGDRPLANVDRELVELLGMGGFGEVWKARNPHFDGLGPVALKFCVDARARRMLRHEATVLNQVQRHGTHSGVVALRQTYLNADPPCLEYDYIEGRDLATLIRTAGPANDHTKVKAVTGLLRDLAETAGFMHRLEPPVVHRDLKPGNVLLSRSEGVPPATRSAGVPPATGDADTVAGETPALRVAGGTPALRERAKITDFGIGAIAATTAVAGQMTTILRGACTPLYASPQQREGHAPDPRDDVYSLGVIWYQLLVGDPGRAAGADVEDELHALGVDGDVVALVRRCLSTKPERRPADGGVLASEIAALLDVPTSPPPPPIFTPPTIHAPQPIRLGDRDGLRYRIDHYFPFTGVRAVDDRLSSFPVNMFLPNRPAERTPTVIVLQALAKPMSWGAYLVPLLVDRGVACVMIEAPLAGDRGLVGSHRGDILEEITPLCAAGVSPTGPLVPRLMEATARDVGTVIRLLEQRHGLTDRRRALLGIHFGCLLAAFTFLRDYVGEKLLGVRGHADLYHFVGPLLAEINPADTEPGRWLRALLEDIGRGGSRCRQANPMTYVDRAGSRRVRFMVGEHLNRAKVENARANASRFREGKCHVRPGAERDEQLAGRVEEFVTQQLSEWMLR